MSGGQVTGSDLSTAGHYDSGVVPVSNDLVTVPGSNQNDIIDSGGQLSGIDLDLLATEPGFAKQFGTESTPIEGATDKLSVRGAGGFFFDCHNGGGSLKTDLAVIDAATPSTRVVLGSVTGSKGDWVDVAHSRGNLTLAGNTAFDAAAAVRVGGRQRNDTQLLIEAGAETLSRLEVATGPAIVHNVVTNLVLCGVGVTCEKRTAQATNIWLWPGTTLHYYHKATAGQVLSIVVYPGARLNLKASHEPKTIDKVTRMKGGIVDWIDDPKMHVITDFQDYEKN